MQQHEKDQEKQQESFVSTTSDTCGHHNICRINNMYINIAKITFANNLRELVASFKSVVLMFVSFSSYL